MHFLELPKLKISDVKKIKKSEQWGAYFSGKYSDEELEVLSMNNPAIKQALDYEAFFNSNDEMRRKYLAREEAILDEKLRNGYSHQKGKLEGKQKEKIQNVINGLKEGIDINIIAKITKLSTEEIEQIKAKYL